MGASDSRAWRERESFGTLGVTFWGPCMKDPITLSPY